MGLMRSPYRYLMIGMVIIMVFLIVTKDFEFKRNLSSAILTNVETTQEQQQQQQQAPVFVIIVCLDDETNTTEVTSSISRQMNQVTVLLKSAVRLTNETLRFIVLSNSDKAFEKVTSIPLTWPPKFRNRLQFESRSVWYPPDRTNLRNLLRPCSSARLFLPEILTDVDAAVLIDTDTVFLAPPEDLYREFLKFNSLHGVGMAQTSRGYNRRNIPYPKPDGVNTGVMVMNMTRLRDLPQGWTGANLNAFDDYEDRLSVTATNDIVNIALAKNLELFYDLDCVWNYNSATCCTLNGNLCPNADITGAYLVHGVAGSFVSDKVPRIKDLFSSWLEYDIENPLQELVADMKRRFKSSDAIELKPIIANHRKKWAQSLDQHLTKSLETIIGTS